MKKLYYAIQTILHGRGSNVTKVISLSLGLTIGILLFSQIAFELSYEKCYPEAEHLGIARGYYHNIETGETLADDGDGDYDYSVMDPMAATMAENMPEQIESATCINAYSANANYYYEDKKVKDENCLLVDTCFFRTLGIPVLKGDPKDMINSNCVFVSRKFTRDIFGDADPIGKVLMLEKKTELVVRGIYQDMSENTMFHADFVASLHHNGGYKDGDGWRGNDIFYAVFRTRKASDMDIVNDNIQRMVEKYTPTEHNGWKLELSVIPLAEKHQVSKETQKRLVLYGFLGFSIFFVAIMNYMLIVIATLGRRAKGVGVHKCSGASNGNIFGMFMLETGIIVLVSVIVSLFIIINSQDLIEDLFSVKLSSLFTWGTLWVPLLTIVILFILAGVLPGRIFSRIPVTQVFRRYTDGKKGWKRSLLFVQFTGVSFVLGLLLVTLMQYSLLMNRDMGIRTAGLTEAESWLDPKIVPNLRDEIRRQPMVESVAAASHSVLGQYWTQGLLGSDGKRIGILNMNHVDYNYPEVMGMTIIEGKPMTHENDLLVNEEIVRLKKWTDGAVGKPFDELKGGTIVGVFRDVRNQSFYAPQQPIVLIGKDACNHNINVRLKEPYDENLKRLNEFMLKSFPNVALVFRSVDRMVEDMYKDVYRFRNSVLITSSFILLIVIMGLIGYVNDETQRRSKEIAIRKVNGAEASAILRLLARDILYVSIPSILIGTGISYFTGKAWLEQFAEQINLNPLLFIGMALAVMVVIVACVIVKAWRIANENPVNSIKSE
ncbi:MAG: FtsX-like permease family protein [Bacteroides sp.]|nr:FtsX-like permease family protein [Bacteroides sp.]